MNFALNSLGCPEWSFDRLLDNAVENNIKYLEIRGILGKMRAAEIPEFSEEGYPALAEKLNARGIKIVGFGCSSSFHNPEKCESAYEEAKEAIDVCTRIGINFVRIFGNNVPDPAKEAATIELVAEYCRRLCDYAISVAKDGKAPVTVLIEAHGDFNTWERLLPVCHKVDRENFGLLWDVAHTDKAYGDNILPFYNIMKPYIKHLHFKDHIRVDGGWKLSSVGEGDIPLFKILDTLKADGYNGCISIEHEKKWHPELADPQEEFARFAALVKEYV